MGKSTGKVAALAALLLVATLQPVTAEAGHSGNLNVQVAQFFGVGPNCNQETGKGCRAAESMRFLAPTLRVHRGDVINFDIQGLHTATFLPRPSDYLDWVVKQSGGVAKPYSIWGPDPDDTSIDAGGSDATPSIKMKNFLPSEVDCGSAAAPCPYDGSKVINSGIPVMQGSAAPFSVRIDAAPDANNAIWVVCLVHPHMFMRIFVVPDGEAATTQTAIDTDKAAKLAQDMEWASSTDARLSKGSRSHVTADGKRVFDVYAGMDNHWASLFAFYPLNLQLKRGQTARFHFTDGIYEVHNAVFPYGQALEESQFSFVPTCDNDGDSGTAPDELLAEGPPCGGDLSKLEVDVQPRVFYQQGDGTFNGSSTDYENSGIRGATPVGAATRNDPWDLRFTKASRKAYLYFCQVHGAFMSGRVTVK